MTPYQQPSDGLAQIAALWERERDGPDEVFTMESDIVAVEGDTGVVRVHVTYGEPVADEFLDLWIIRLDEIGRCTAFEEWAFPAD